MKYLKSGSETIFSFINFENPLQFSETYKDDEINNRHRTLRFYYIFFLDYNNDNQFDHISVRMAHLYVILTTVCKTIDFNYNLKIIDCLL